jgi:cell division protein FtsQ
MTGPTDADAGSAEAEGTTEPADVTLPAAAAADYEGPRRAARREREQRRAA